MKPKILQRGMYVGKQLVVTHGLARRAVPGSALARAARVLPLAEMLECAMTSVSDNLLPNAVGISCYSTYSHALLLGLADPCAMSVRQIELTDRWLAMWARKVFPYAQQRETEGPVILIDLDGGAGAALVPSAPANPAASMRFGYPGKLATSVRGRLKRLQSGANPAELQLGHDCSIDQCTTLLGHLDSRWYQIPRRRPSAPEKAFELCSGGLPAAYFRVSGRTFERKDPAGRLSYADAQQLQAIAAVVDYDNGREERRSRVGWEHWQGTFESRDAMVARESEPGRRWMLDQLAVMRSDGVVRVGYVTRVAMGGDGQLGAEGQLALTLRIWSAAPVAMTLLPLSAASSDDPPLPALRLDETPDDKASLVLPPRTFNPSRVLRCLDVGPDRRYRLTRLLQRGIDFERVSFEETPERHPAGIPRKVAATAAMPNRLAGETSPYLIQHAGNPVDWHPWDDEALSLARREGKPILLSIGYSACHWCHVMAHESFEDPRVAAAMNADFVNIKVDREERPDLDQIYQTAHALMTRRSGGWPLTMFLTPDGAPFFGGTYFPKEGRYGLPGFLDLLPRVAAAYRERGADIAEQAAELKNALASLEPAPDGRAAALHRHPPRRRSRSSSSGSIPNTAGSARRPSFRTRPISSSACASTFGPATPTHSTSSASRSRGWPRAAFTISWAAASAATASMRSGRFRTSRRCSTTTARCSACTRTSRG